MNSLSHLGSDSPPAQCSDSFWPGRPPGARHLRGGLCRALATCSLPLLLAACGTLKNLGGDDESQQAAGGGVGSIPPHLRAGNQLADSIPTQQVNPGVDPASLVSGLPEEEDIMWTDPERYEEGIPGLADVMEQPTGRSWLTSYSVARRLSRETGKPLLIWFMTTQSGTGSKSRTISRELLSRADFDTWASENFIRLRLDYNPGITFRGGDVGDQESKATRKQRYLQRLKEHYKVHGYPTLLTLAPDGTVIQRERGYRSGQAEFVWGLLKTAHHHATRHREKERKSLEKRGYRTWTGTNGRSLFARLYRRQGNDLVLAEPNGTTHQTTVANLSAPDQKWLKENR